MVLFLYLHLILSSMYWRAQTLSVTIHWVFIDHLLCIMQWRLETDKTETLILRSWWERQTGDKPLQLHVPVLPAEEHRKESKYVCMTLSGYWHFHRSADAWAGFWRMRRSLLGRQGWDVPGLKCQGGLSQRAHRAALPPGAHWTTKMRRLASASFICVYLWFCER